MTIECLETNHQYYLMPYSVVLLFVIPLAIISVSNIALAVAPVEGSCHLTEACCPLIRAPEPTVSAFLAQDSGTVP